MDTLEFGEGTTFIAKPGAVFNDVSSTKQPYTPASGLLVIASDATNELALFGRLGDGRKQARRPYHRVELVAQLVADVGKQIRIDLDQPMLMAVGALLRRRRCSDVTKFAHQ